MSFGASTRYYAFCNAHTDRLCFTLLDVPARHDEGPRRGSTHTAATARKWLAEQGWTVVADRSQRGTHLGWLAYCPKHKPDNNGGVS